MKRVKYLSVRHPLAPRLSEFPNFSSSGSITGMRKKYYGQDCLLVKSGAYIYNVTAEPEIYQAAH